MSVARRQLPEVVLAKNPKQFLTSRLTNRALTQTEEPMIEPRRRFNSYHYIKTSRNEGSISKLNSRREIVNNSSFLVGKPHFRRERLERNYSQRRQERPPLPKIKLFMDKIETQVKEINTVLKAHIQTTNELVRNKMSHIIGEIQRYNTIQPYQEDDSQQSSQYEEKILPYRARQKRFKKQPYKKNSSPPPPPKYKTFSKERIGHLMSKWRKCGNAILFILFLQRFCKKMREVKQNLSLKVFERFPSYLMILREMIQYNLKYFAEVLYSKRDILFEVEQGDSREVGLQKIQLSKKIINVMLKDLLTVFKSSIGNKQIAKFLYVMCKHGNFSIKRALFTKEQLKVSCVSHTFKNISAECNLQKVALINLIIIKIMLFKMFFTEERLSKAMKQQNTPKNIYILGSILYTLVIQLQNDYLQKVPESYQLGNFVEYSHVNTLVSMSVGKNQFKRGEILNGLRDRNWIKAVYKIGSWELQTKMLRQIIQLAHQAIVKFHGTVQSQII